MKPHRKWFKLLLNPILRKFGYSIVSVFHEDKLVGYMLRPYPQYCGPIDNTKEGETQIGVEGEQFDDRLVSGLDK